MQFVRGKAAIRCAGHYEACFGSVLECEADQANSVRVFFSWSSLNVRRNFKARANAARVDKLFIIERVE